MAKRDLVGVRERDEDIAPDLRDRLRRSVIIDFDDVGRIHVVNLVPVIARVKLDDLG